MINDINSKFDPEPDELPHIPIVHPENLELEKFPLTKILLAVLLGIASLGIMALGIWRIKAVINGPFQSAKNAFADSTVSGSATETNETAPLKNRDTDKDGLSDYDELNVYRTSPYLEDSDSDGYSDEEEIESSHDPNCPIGQICQSAAGNEEETSATEPTNNSLPEGFSSIAELRQALEASGVPKETLDQIDDATLVEIYNQTASETDANLNSQNSVPTTEAPANLEQMPPAEVRQLLIQSGMDENLLNQVSDEVLMQMVAESIKQ